MKKLKTFLLSLLFFQMDYLHSLLPEESLTRVLPSPVFHGFHSYHCHDTISTVRSIDPSILVLGEITLDLSGSGILKQARFLSVCDLKTEQVFRRAPGDGPAESLPQRIPPPPIDKILDAVNTFGFNGIAVSHDVRDILPNLLCSNGPDIVVLPQNTLFSVSPPIAGSFIVPQTWLLIRLLKKHFESSNAGSLTLRLDPESPIEDPVTMVFLHKKFRREFYKRGNDVIFPRASSIGYDTHVKRSDGSLNVSQKI